MNTKKKNNSYTYEYFPVSYLDKSDGNTYYSLPLLDEIEEDIKKFKVSGDFTITVTYETWDEEDC